MTYYLSKLWLWWLLAVVVGALLTSWLCRRAGRPGAGAGDERYVRELADARAEAARHEAKVDELLAVRARELDELTTLRAQGSALDGMRSRIRALEGDAGAVPTLEAEVRTLRSEAERVPLLEDEVEGLRRQLVEVRSDNERIGPLEARLHELETELAAARDAAAATATAAAARPRAAAAPRRAAEPTGAAAVLGRRVKPDDLKAVEGIGPKIEQLLQADGITTWRELAEASAERVRSVLAAAGPRFQVHDPTTWPAQAALLAEGRWAEFKELTDSLKAGRA